MARDGPPDADKLLIVSSACHGVEGFAAAACRCTHCMTGLTTRGGACEGVAVLYIHALNPYGFSHLRRVTHENVDLNRNFQDFGQPCPSTRTTPPLRTLSSPTPGRRGDNNQAAVQRYLANGESAWQAAISGGQHATRRACFGGTRPTWSHRTLRQVLRRTVAQRGASAGSTCTLAGAQRPWRAHLRRPRRRQRRGAPAAGGTAAATRSLRSTTAAPASAFLTGLMWNAIYDVNAHRPEFTGMRWYGTMPIHDMIEACAPNSGCSFARPTLRWPRRSRRRCNAFYTDTDARKGRVIAQARQALFQAVQGLGL